MVESKQDIQWELLPTSIAIASKSNVEAGSFDDAILAAFRYVEGEIQERIGSTQIGKNLLDEAFDGSAPKIEIATATTRHFVKALFAGAFGLIRNDRAHKKKPVLPCASLGECAHYLGFAALLLDLLSKDRALFPSVSDVEYKLASKDNAEATFKGSRLDSSVRIESAVGPLKILRVSEDAIDAALPKHYVGTLEVFSQSECIFSVSADTRELKPGEANAYEVLYSDIPLYSDPECTELRTECVGLLLECYEVGRTYRRITPVRPAEYPKGSFLSLNAYEKNGLDRTWYRDPELGAKLVGWDGSLINSPSIVSNRTDLRLTGLKLQPNPIRAAVGDIVTLSVRFAESGGVVRIEQELPSINISSSNPKVAFVNNGVLRAKALGTSTLSCAMHGIGVSAIAEIVQPIRGEPLSVFHGLRNLGQMRFDGDGSLLMTNQTRYVFRRRPDGTVERAIALQQPDTYPSGIDRLAVDHERGLVVNSVFGHKCYYFKWNGAGYEPGRELGRGYKEAKKSIAVRDGHTFIGAMSGQPGSGYVIHVMPDGSETAFRTRDQAFVLDIGQDGNLYIPCRAPRAEIDVYAQDGTFVRSLRHGMADSVTDICVDDNLGIVLGFWSGKVGRLSVEGDEPLEVMAAGFGAVTGIAINEKGQVHVADFISGCIQKIA